MQALFRPLSTTLDQPSIVVYACDVRLPKYESDRLLEYDTTKNMETWAKSGGKESFELLNQLRDIG
jgi:hypothetical protein